jgi:chitinase
LSYKEITDIITQNSLTPYYDEENAVKYIVWNQDQWVSYVSLECPVYICVAMKLDEGLDYARNTVANYLYKDDEVTIKQKLDFANGLGLGGVLIWSVSE